jgi:glycosyltransferase involved in cell wall biosynthesis
MKLLIYTHFWTPSIGGVETLASALANDLTRRYHASGENPIDVTIVSGTPAGNVDDSLSPFRVVRCPGLSQLIREIRASDIVEIEGPALLPQLLGWLFRKPVILQHHGYQTVCPNGLLVLEQERALCPGHFMAGRYRKCIACNSKSVGLAGSIRLLLLMVPRRWLAKHATVNVATSEHVGRRVALPHTRLIWNGVPDLALANRGGVEFSPEPVETDPVRFAYLGRLVAEKGVNVLIRACAELAAEGRQFALTIVGDGPERAPLESLANELGLAAHITFTGPKRGADIAKTLAGAAAVVMTPIWEEVSPLVAIEQMIQGRLLIASDIGGLTEMVGDAGLKFPPGDSIALAKLLRRVLDDPSIAVELGAQARARALLHFTEKRMTDEHVALYEELYQAQK